MEIVVVEVVRCIEEAEVQDWLGRMEGYEHVNKDMKIVGSHHSEKHLFEMRQSHLSQSIEH